MNNSSTVKFKILDTFVDCADSIDPQKVKNTTSLRTLPNEPGNGMKTTQHANAPCRTVQVVALLHLEWRAGSLKEAQRRGASPPKASASELQVTCVGDLGCLGSGRSHSLRESKNTPGVLKSGRKTCAECTWPVTLCPR